MIAKIINLLAHISFKCKFLDFTSCVIFYKNTILSAFYGSDSDREKKYKIPLVTLKRSICQAIWNKNAIIKIHRDNTGLHTHSTKSIRLNTSKI